MSDIKFGAAVIYVPEGAKDVLDFYSRAFGLSILSYDPTYDFGELDTGESKIAIASHVAGEFMVGEKYPQSGNVRPVNVEIALLTSDVPAAFVRAVNAGCTPLCEPKTMPWGQTVAYVTSIEGTLVGLLTPPQEQE
ncbi:VOC family protein [Iningainema tapete]|uniref:VOC family protein n=1 Tax=Iningainema tapete BLCC-T55 TaxID=2748662 RepID=A0A8J6XMQ6_9CYAN|nr:VOC family protein [Iningainema tapete]MBD2777833.1 VOC family protein [Iningainema tapete BLCC-T55]